MEQTLNKKWKELLFAASGFGPNFLMVLMGAYYTDALNPVALGSGNTYQAILSGTCFILPALFPILYSLGKIFDGIIDIPFAQITDSFSSKWGRRRPPIAISMLPMILSYAMLWIPVGGTEKLLLNTIWFISWSFVFFASYTMCLISFYGSLSTVCSNSNQRARVAGYKSFFDTVNYCIVYALVPLILDLLRLPINKFALRCLPVMLTIAIPLFMIKEGEKYGYPEGPGLKSQKINLLKSLNMTFGNKVYRKWLVVECCTTIGLQMFLVSMNAMMIGSIGFNGTQMAITNTCAFAPVPVMLYLFNKLKAKKGTRFCFQTCLGAFSVALLAFFFASLYVIGPGKLEIQMIIAASGGIIGSWAIGSFFMMPYLANSQIASVEEELTGINHSAMYFAAEALCTSIIGAVSGSLIYENIKMLFISKAAKGIVYASSIADAAMKFGTDPSMVYNFGTLLVPFIVSASCIVGIIASRRLPKDFSSYDVALEFKRYNKDIDISKFEKFKKEEDEEKGEFVFLQVALSILSGFIFGLIWPLFMFKSVIEITGKGKRLPRWLLSCFIPFASIVIMIKLHKELEEKAAEENISLSGSMILYVITGVVLPVLPLNIVALAVMQRNINKVLRAQ